jgi:hypothetical protein
MSIVSKLRQVLEGKRKVVESVNTKAGSTLPDTCNWDTLSETITNISTGIETNDATATASDILKDKVAYGKEGRMVGAIETYDGASDVGVSGNTLKNLLDATKSVENLFIGYAGDSVSGLIQYNDTENVEKFDGMYRNNYYLLDNIILNTSNARTMYGTFYGCWKVKKIELSYYNFSSASATNQTFRECRSLKALIIRSFSEQYVLNSNAFNECFWLLGQTNSKYNPNGEQGYIYIPRNMISILQAETNWSVMQFRALEDYTKDGTTTGEFDDAKAGI